MKRVVGLTLLLLAPLTGFAAEFLPNSCALFLHSTRKDGSIGLARCTAVAISPSKLLTSYHCVSPVEKELFNEHVEITKSVPIAVGCGYRGEADKLICPINNQDAPFPEIEDCLKRNFSTGALIKSSSVARPPLERAKAFAREHDLKYEGNAAYAGVYYAILMSADISAIQLKAPLQAYVPAAKIPPLSYLDDVAKLRDFKYCHADGFGTGVRKTVEKFYAKSVDLDSRRINFTSALPTDPLSEETRQALKDEFGLTELNMHLTDFSHGDSGAPIYCSNDRKSWTLIGLHSRERDDSKYRDGRDYASTFLTPETASLVGLKLPEKKAADPGATNVHRIADADLICDYRVYAKSLRLKRHWDTQWHDDNTNEVHFKLDAVGDTASYLHRREGYVAIGKSDADAKKWFDLCPAGKKWDQTGTCTGILLKSREAETAILTFDVWESDDYYLASEAKAVLMKMDPLPIGTLAGYANCSSAQDVAAGAKKYCATVNASSGWIDAKLTIVRECDGKQKK